MRVLFTFLDSDTAARYSVVYTKRFVLDRKRVIFCIILLIKINSQLTIVLSKYITIKVMFKIRSTTKNMQIFSQERHWQIQRGNFTLFIYAAPQITAHALEVMTSCTPL